MDLKKNNLLYEEINKNHIKILKSKNIAAFLNSIYDDKIDIKFIVYG